MSTAIKEAQTIQKPTPKKRGKTAARARSSYLLRQRPLARHKSVRLNVGSPKKVSKKTGKKGGIQEVTGGGMMKDLKDGTEKMIVQPRQTDISQLSSTLTPLPDTLIEETQTQRNPSTNTNITAPLPVTSQPTPPPPIPEMILCRSINKKTIHPPMSLPNGTAPNGTATLSLPTDGGTSEDTDSLRGQIKELKSQLASTQLRLETEVITSEAKVRRITSLIDKRLWELQGEIGAILKEHQ